MNRFFFFIIAVMLNEKKQRTTRMNIARRMNVDEFSLRLSRESGKLNGKIETRKK